MKKSAENLLADQYVMTVMCTKFARFAESCLKVLMLKKKCVGGCIGGSIPRQWKVSHQGDLMRTAWIAFPM